MKLARLRILLGVGGGLIVIAAVFFLMPPQRPEPVYRGKSLTRWLKRLDDGEAFGISSHALPSPTAAQIQAAEAIRAMGSEALPFLKQDIHASPSPDRFRFKVQTTMNRVLGRRFGIWLPFTDITEEDRVRWRAAQGLAALGPLAKPAIPELKRLLHTNYFHSSIKEAAYALAAVGPEGVEVLTNALEQNEWSAMCAIWALGQHPAAGTNVIPFLIKASESRSEGIACGAIQVLGLFHTDGATVIPALTAALTNSNPRVRYDAAIALGRYPANSGNREVNQ